MQLPNNSEIYLDNNATTKALPEIIASIVASIGENFGNPSSSHSAGDRAREILSSARANIAELIGCDSEQIIFTSCGTEANNLILSSAASWSKQAACILTTTVEHSSVLAMCDHLEAQGANIIKLPVNQHGMLDLSRFETIIRNATLVSVQWVNNETGVIQPIEEIGRLCRNSGVPFHTDAAQAVGKIHVTLSGQPIDFLTLTGHKFHAPQGIGALYAKDPKRLQPMLFGGGQENSLRPGTENVAGIAGIGSAAFIRHRKFADVVARIDNLRNLFENQVLERISDVRINGGSSPRVCNTSNIVFDALDGQALIARLDQVGIRCSQSSACTNHRPEPSYVLKSMGLSEDQAYASVRFSFSELNTPDEIEFVVDTLADLCKKLREFNL